MDEETRLMTVIARYPSVLAAYSGGVDSTLVAAAALRALGPERVCAVTGDSPSVARSEMEAAARTAAALGIPWRAIATQETADPRYIANAPSRCYFCKSTLYGELERLRAALDFAVIMDGFNSDDLGDFRPGRQAGEEHRVVSPLKEAGLGKEAVRRLARRWGLPNADKPASPCLASRIPYGVPVTVERLAQVERAEAALRALGFDDVRVRHHEAVARIEIPLAAWDRLMAVREAAIAGVRAAGYRFVTVDLAGLRSGSFNEAVRHAQLAGTDGERTH